MDLYEFYEVAAAVDHRRGGLAKRFTCRHHMTVIRPCTK